MARPKIFISSTFYDLKQIRNDLEVFIRDLGYDPVLNERGNIPYGNTEKLEEYCYKEIDQVEILVSIIGNRFGTGSQHAPHSISQMELNTAIKRGKQVYIFVEKAVEAEYRTYAHNKDVPIKYQAVDNVEVYRFLEQVKALPTNNAIAQFESSQDIIRYLREQWAGLFQRFLQEQQRSKEVNVLERMESVAETLDQLVTFLTDERKNTNAGIRQILLMNHPLFEKIKRLTNTPYRVFFVSYQELNTWLEQRRYKYVETPPGSFEWSMSDERTGKTSILSISDEVFEADGSLKIITAHEWNEEWLNFWVHEDPSLSPPISANDIPF